MQLARSLFLNGKWKQDSPRLNAAVSVLAADPAFQLVLFPEGAPINADSVAKSNTFAAANNLKPLQFVLHPRTTGFGYLVEKMREGRVTCQTTLANAFY
jgi:lysocardiolipin and lysophospholipid acyltransferase